MATETNERSTRNAQIGMESLFAGSSNEDLAKALFKRWKWTAGKPEPDVGADLVVEIPSASEIQGAAFTAQIRSGRKWRVTEKIKRPSALRLKGSPLPAFMIFINRTTLEARWANLELLFDTEASFRNGGDLFVHLSATDGFAVLCTAPPSEFLEAVYHAKKRGAMKSAGTLSSLADAVHDHYRQIDPSIAVRASFDGQRDVLTITARNEPVTMSIQVVEPSERSKSALREAFEWGRPARVEARKFVLSGSPVWKLLSEENLLTRLVFHPEPAWQGRAILSTHANGNKRHTEVVDAELTRGTLGGEFALMVCQGLLQLRIRINASLESNAHISIEYSVMSSWKIMKLEAAGRVLKILDGALAGDLVELQLIGFMQDEIAPVRFRWNSGSVVEFEELTFPLRAAEALFRIANCQGWQIDGHPLSRATMAEMHAWILGRQLLDGISSMLRARNFRIDFTEPPYFGKDDTAFGNFLLDHSLEISVGGEVVGQLPVRVRFCNYHVVIERAFEGAGWRLLGTPGDGATCEYLAPNH